jgi:5,5'-dehydrodivanillate O-demethylase
MIFRVPMDDTSTMQFYIRFYASDKKSINYQRKEEKLGVYRQLAEDWWGIDVGDQDRMAIEQQGVVADRPNEHLGVSDGGNIKQRKMLRESLALIEEGKDPLSVIRDPEQQKIIFPQKSSMMEKRQDHLNYNRAFVNWNANAAE